jgi:hypothetical protein
MPAAKPLARAEPAANAEKGGALAVNVAYALNTTTATISGDASVDAKGAISVDAQTLNQIDPASLWGVNLVESLKDKTWDDEELKIPEKIKRGLIEELKWDRPSKI